jgi:hypothetical protein
MNWLAVVRYGATAVLAGLASAYTYYPHVLWLPIAIAVLGTLGIHVIPTATQSKTGAVNAGATAQDRPDTTPGR